MGRQIAFYSVLWVANHQKFKITALDEDKVSLIPLKLILFVHTSCSGLELCGPQLK